MMTLKRLTWQHVSQTLRMLRYPDRMGARGHAIDDVSEIVAIVPKNNEPRHERSSSDKAYIFPS